MTKFDKNNSAQFGLQFLREKKSSLSFFLPFVKHEVLFSLFVFSILVVFLLPFSFQLFEPEKIDCEKKIYKDLGFVFLERISFQ